MIRLLTLTLRLINAVKVMFMNCLFNLISTITFLESKWYLLMH